MARELQERVKTAAIRMAAATSPASRTAARAADAPQARPETSDAGPVSPVVPLRLLRFPAVRERTGLSRSTIWRLERRGEFPRHRRISANAVAWVEQEVAHWIQSRVRPEAG